MHPFYLVVAFGLCSGRHMTGIIRCMLALEPAPTHEDTRDVSLLETKQSLHRLSEL